MISAPLAADELERCAAAGVPVDEVHGKHAWVACLEPDSLPPTDAELAVIRSYIEFVLNKAYNPQLAARALAQPLAYVTGHNAVVLRKDADSWRYSRPTWTTPRYPRYLPSQKTDLFPFLTDLLDQIEDLRPELWMAWKAEHAETFRRTR